MFWSGNSALKEIEYHVLSFSVVVFGECERSGVYICKCDSVLVNGILLQIHVIFSEGMTILKYYIDS